MDSTVSAASTSTSWEITSGHGLAVALLVVLFVYLWVRHLFLTLMVMDVIIGWLRQFRWFPKEGKRLKTFVHWLIAMGLFIVYLIVAIASGWLDAVPS